MCDNRWTKKYDKRNGGKQQRAKKIFGIGIKNSRNVVQIRGYICYNGEREKVIMLHKWITYIYPKRCVICDKVLKHKEEHICCGCRNKAETVKEPFCMHCGKPIEYAEDEYCYDCAGQTFHTKRGAAVWVYDKHMKQSITRFKYQGRQEYADYYSKEIINHYEAYLREMGTQALIPVPIHKSKLRYRGFNQAELLAEKIGEKIEVPVEKHILVRKRNTMPQKGLTNRERYQNLNHAFTINDKYREKCRSMNNVILVDDIYTTGATIEACAGELTNAGIENIYFICLCIGKDF
jgi:ComF family protein